jgi:hypothetical protein
MWPLFCTIHGRPLKSGGAPKRWYRSTEGLFFVCQGGGSRCATCPLTQEYNESPRLPVCSDLDLVWIAAARSLIVMLVVVQACINPRAFRS